MFCAPITFPLPNSSCSHPIFLSSFLPTSLHRPFSTPDDSGVHALITDAVYAAGYACSESAAAFRAVINAAATGAGAAGKNLVFGESECARLVAMLARTHGRALHGHADAASAAADAAAAGWSLPVIVQTLMQMVRERSPFPSSSG